MRDRVLHAVFGVGLLLVLLVPVFSDFSMRQVQESAISLALSCSSLTLLVVAALLGSATVFRDVDRRYTAAVLGLPLSRSVYLMGKLIGLTVFLALVGMLLFVSSAVVIGMAAASYPSPQPIPWTLISLAFFADVLKSIIVASLAMLFSSVSTSFSLPFFCSIGIWLGGSASQEAFEYVNGSLGKDLPAIIKSSAYIFYYLLPNFSGLDYHLQAIYGLTMPFSDVLASFAYALFYCAIVAWLSTAVFTRRELP
jgi:ABC-type transport system involved in multi-copper enzyme maturation permease subunit